jgi:uncharacterized protein YfiM (DUF2279 family)
MDSRLIKIFLLIGFLLAHSICLNSQSSIASHDTAQHFKSSFRRAVVYTSAYYAGSLFILGKTWYKDKDLVPFHFYNDNKAYLQVDKFGHAFGSYVYSYMGYHYLRNSGYSRKDALLYGSTLGLILQTPIEIMDGIHEGYGFSWGDMVANASGSVIVLGQELLFKEQVVKYKFSYWESAYSHNANGLLGETTLNRIFKDYNGQTYWFSLAINKLKYMKPIPNWLNIAVGYSANGMYGEFQNLSSYAGITIPETDRYRQYLISMDIDWTKIETNSKLIKMILKGLTFFKLPFPTVEYNSLGTVKGYWLYY